MVRPSSLGTASLDDQYANLLLRTFSMTALLKNELSSLECQTVEVATGFMKLVVARLDDAVWYKSPQE